MELVGRARSSPAAQAREAALLKEPHKPLPKAKEGDDPAEKKPAPKDVFEAKGPRRYGHHVVDHPLRSDLKSVPELARIARASGAP